MADMEKDLEVEVSEEEILAEELEEVVEEAMEEGDKELASYFANRAKHRMADAREAERWIDNSGGADSIHEAYKEYHEEQCARLKRKLDRLM